MPGVLKAGLISPVAALIDSPGPELKLPPDVPVSSTACGVLIPWQYGAPLYCIAAVGAALTITSVVTTKLVQPPVPATVYAMVYLPGTAADGSSVPLPALIINPDEGEIE